MKNLIVLNHKVAAVVLLFMSSLVVAQDHYKEKFTVGSDAIVSIDVSYADVVFETWDKNFVEVEAYIEGKDLSEKEKKEIFENWNFDVLGNSKKVVITANNGNNWDELQSLHSIEGLKSLESLTGLDALKSLEELGDMDWNIEVPDVPNYEEFPNWPFSDSQPNIKSGKDHNSFNYSHGGSINFDSDTYEKDKKAYVDKLNKKYKTSVSVKEVDKWLDDVERWAEGFEKVMENWGEEFEMKFGP